MFYDILITTKTVSTNALVVSAETEETVLFKNRVSHVFLK